jgi:hypothetical protein
VMSRSDVSLRLHSRLVPMTRDALLAPYC